MKTLLLVGAGVLMAGAAAMLAGCAGHHKGWGCHRSPDKIASFITNKIAGELNLNAEQKTKLEAIKNEIIAKHKEKKPDHTAMQAEIKALLLKDRIDPTEINNLIDQKMKEHAEMKEFLVSKFVEFHAILTPAQRQKLVEKLEKHHADIEKCHE